MLSCEFAEAVYGGGRAGLDRLVAKTIIGYAFPVPGKRDDAGDRAPNRPPTARSTMRTSTNSAFPPDLLALR